MVFNESNVSFVSPKYFHCVEYSKVGIKAKTFIKPLFCVSFARMVKKIDLTYTYSVRANAYLQQHERI